METETVGNPVTRHIICNQYQFRWWPWRPAGTLGSGWWTSGLVTPRTLCRATGPRSQPCAGVRAASGFWPLETGQGLCSCGTHAWLGGARASARWTGLGQLAGAVGRSLEQPGEGGRVQPTLLLSFRSLRLRTWPARRLTPAPFGRSGSWPAAPALAAGAQAPLPGYSCPRVRTGQSGSGILYPCKRGGGPGTLELN